MLPIVESPELVFGLCSAVGTDNLKAHRLLEAALAKFGYRTETFKVTSLMRSLVLKDFPLLDAPFGSRYDSRIKYANQLRSRFDDPSILAKICCSAIRNYRRNTTGAPDGLVERTAYLIDQLKRKEEVEQLRQVYGGLFVLVSIYSDKERRTENLVSQFIESHSVSRATPDHHADARRLIARDESEDRVKHGQRLRDTFPLADLFIDIDDEAEAQLVIDRFTKALFGSPSISPTPDEYGMYLAKSAAFRSLDLSRQVGAAVIAGRGDVITMGCNDVPRAGGGTYWAGDKPDDRDYARGHDENDRLKRSILADVVRRLIDRELVSTSTSVEELVDAVLADVSLKGSSLREAELMDLLEFGRIIHAEMHALCDAARLGKSVRDATLFCNVFPCHICAKHIVASGIARVVFIEPYPKSYAEDLHRDSIVVRRGHATTDKVQFEPFIGISPSRFRELFERGRRKETSGKLQQWLERDAQPSPKLTIRSYLHNETAVTNVLSNSTEKLVASGVIVVNDGTAPNGHQQQPDRTRT